MMRDYRLDPPEPIPTEICNQCGEDLYPGEDAYRIGDHYYCTDCVVAVTIEEGRLCYEAD